MGTAKPHHPLMELLGRLLLGIEIVPKDEQGRMVSRACKEAVLWHEAEVKRLGEDARAVIGGARQILWEADGQEIATIKALRLHFSTARSLLLVYTPAPPSVCRALSAASEGPESEPTPGHGEGGR